ncbi:MAG: copper-binding protein [Pseudomonadota bacterium]
MNKLNMISFAILLSACTGAFATPTMIDGEIRKVDKDAAKLTIKHAELTNLGMPPMTMVFKVQDKAMLAQVAAGDKVRFAADKIGGALTVTALVKEAP